MRVIARKTIGCVGYGNWWTFVLSLQNGHKQWLPEVSSTKRFPNWTTDLAFQWPTDLKLVKEYTPC